MCKNTSLNSIFGGCSIGGLEGGGVEAAEGEVEEVGEGEGNVGGAEYGVAQFWGAAFHLDWANGVEVAEVAFVAACVAHHGEHCHLHGGAIGAVGVVLGEVFVDYGVRLVERAVVLLVDAVGVGCGVVVAVGIHGFVEARSFGSENKAWHHHIVFAIVDALHRVDAAFCK